MLNIGVAPMHEKAKVTAQSIESMLLPKDLEIVRIEYATGKLRAFVRDMDSETEIAIDFDDVLGYRVLDEGNLMEFWSECSTPNGRLFEIHSGGWLSQEANSHFAATPQKAKEYFVAGVDDCLSVISLMPPKVQKNAL